MSHEPLTTSLIAELLPKLLTAFPSKISSQNPQHTAEVYRNGLRGMDGEAVRAAVDISIQTDNFFPKVARLRELASEWTRRNRAVAIMRVEAVWHTCSVCGAKATTRQITRTVRHPEYYHRRIVPTPGELPTLEKIESQCLYMDHDARAHHVFASDAEGAA